MVVQAVVQKEVAGVNECRKKSGVNQRKKKEREKNEKRKGGRSDIRRRKRNRPREKAGEVGSRRRGLVTAQDERSTQLTKGNDSGP